MPVWVRLTVAAIAGATLVPGEVIGQVAPAPRGSIAVTVVDTSGRPFASASVVVDSMVPRHTRADGRVLFVDVTPGSRQVEVFAIGMKPQLVTVEVVAGQRTETTVTFERLQTLPAVRVIASHWQRRMIDELPARMAKGHGQFRDSTVLGNLMSWEAALAGLRRGVRVGHAERSAGVVQVLMGVGNRTCAASIYIDGYPVAASRLNNIFPQDIAMIEVYDLRELVPYPFSSVRCGAVIVWTKDVVP